MSSVSSIHVDCRSCFKPFDLGLNKPIALQPCGHSFCEQCVNNVRASASKICLTCSRPIEHTPYNWQCMEALEQLSILSVDLAKTEIEKKKLQDQVQRKERESSLPESRRQADDYLNFGETQLEQKKYEQAERIFHQTIENPLASRKSKDRARLNLLRIVHETTKDEKAARLLFDQIINDPEVDPDVKCKAYYFMGLVYLNENKWSFETFFHDAMFLLGEVMNHPNATVEHRNEARLHLLHYGEKEHANLLLDELLADPNVSAADKVKEQLAMGLRLEEAWFLNTEQAIARFNQVIANAHASPRQKSEAYFRLGKIYAKNEHHINIEQAIHCFTEVIRAPLATYTQWKMIARSELADIYLQTGNIDQAIRLSEQVLQDPLFANEYWKGMSSICLARSYIEIGDKRLGIRLLKQVMNNSRTPEYPRDWAKSILRRLE